MMSWCSKLCAFFQIARGAGCWLVVHNGTLPTRGGSLARSCFRGGCESGLLPRLCDTASREKGVPLPGVSAPTLVDGRGEQQCLKEGGGERCLARGRARYWVGENVTDLLCEHP